MPDDLAIKINSLEIMMEQNNKDHLEIKELISEMSKKIDKALEKKANKWVEKVVVWGLSCVGVVFIGLLVRWVVLLELK